MQTHALKNSIMQTRGLKRSIMHTRAFKITPDASKPVVLKASPEKAV
jgi:hypothetical protein